MSDACQSSAKVDAKAREILERVAPFVAHLPDDAREALARRMAEIELKYQGRSGLIPPTRGR